jgi:hypothetical protein
MSFESCHIEYDLTRRQRLVAGLGVWAPYLGFVMIAVAGTAAVAALAAAVSRWWAFAIVLPLWIVRGFILGLVNVIAVPMQHMDIIVEENGLGYATKSDRHLLCRKPLDVRRTFGCAIVRSKLHHGS